MNALGVAMNSAGKSWYELRNLIVLDASIAGKNFAMTVTAGTVGFSPSITMS